MRPQRQDKEEPRQRTTLELARGKLLGGLCGAGGGAGAGGKVEGGALTKLIYSRETSSVTDAAPHLKYGFFTSSVKHYSDTHIIISTN